MQRTISACFIAGWLVILCSCFPHTLQDIAFRSGYGDKCAIVIKLGDESALLEVTPPTVDSYPSLAEGSIRNSQVTISGPCLEKPIVLQPNSDQEFVSAPLMRGCKYRITARTPQYYVASISIKALVPDSVAHVLIRMRSSEPKIVLK
jgi:hypothetical protein